MSQSSHRTLRAAVVKLSGSDFAFAGIWFYGEFTLGKGSLSSLKPTSICGDGLQARVSGMILVRILTDGNKTFCHREEHTDNEY